MNLTKSIGEWIVENLQDNPSLAPCQICTDGETETAKPPMIVIDETGSEQTNQDGVPIRGVSTFSITVQLLSVPTNDGTSAHQAQKMTRDLYGVVGDLTGMLEFIDGRNNTRVLDIFCDAPILTADDGRRASTITFQILAHPI
jgi:hypothetical protein